MATFQPLSSDLFAVAKSFSEARVMFEALETGTDGVLLRTEDPLEVDCAVLFEIMIRV